MPVKIFVSHTASDATLAGSLIDCLLSSMVLQDEDLRCTSVDGHKLPVGSDFTSTLLDDLDDSSVVIGLITQASLSSSWVLFELGATWGAKKNLKPLVASDVDLKSLPGPLSGRHVAVFKNKGDIAQFIEEIITTIGAKARTAAKISKAIDTLLAAHSEYMSAQQSQKETKKVTIVVKEQSFSGTPYSELSQILKQEIVNIPGNLLESKTDAKLPLLDIFLLNGRTLADGIQNNSPQHSPNSFLYNEVALRLLPYGLVQYEKLPAAQAKYFKRIIISPEGHKFMLHHKRMKANTQSK